MSTNGRPDAASDARTVTIHIPTPLRSSTDGQATVDVAGATVGEALRTLAERYPELESNLYTEDGSLRQFVNIYVDDTDIRTQEGTDTPLGDADEVSIVPSIAGG
jgi:molybdopterin converting factor small subunit